MEVLLAIKRTVGFIVFFFVFLTAIGQSSGVQLADMDVDLRGVRAAAV